MARLECGRCKCVFQDVIRVRKCPLCGNREFSNIEPQVGVMSFPKWFTYQGTIGFFYPQTMRMDEAAYV